MTLRLHRRKCPIASWKRVIRQCTTCRPHRSRCIGCGRPRHGSFCEWKGHAHYYSLALADRLIPHVAWTYKSPTRRFEALAGYLAFYPSKMDACYVDDEQVQAQEGDFYGGWITKNIVGPFKGGPATIGW